MTNKIEQVNEFRKQMSVDKACKKAGVSVQTYYKHRNNLAVEAAQTVIKAGNGSVAMLSVLRQINALDIDDEYKGKIFSLLLA